MADYYAGCSFELPCTPEEAQEIQGAFANGASAHEEVFDDPEYDTLSAETEITPAGIAIFGDEYPNFWAIAGLIQKLAPSALPFGFVWSGWCSRPRLDSFTGGYVLITPDQIEMTNLGDVLSEKLKLP